jgi:serine/threonine-protein kinase
MTQASSPEIAPVREGEILDGKYRVERVLGVGGMGVVVAAVHVQLQTRVALKFLLPAALGSPEVVERFAREARAAVQIQSEHVARVIDVGTLPTGSPYMVMEYLEGSDLADAVSESGPMPTQVAVGYVLQACEAIAEAHALGIVHRDLKPANLFLARRTRGESIVNVLDFGISKTKESGHGLTHTSTMMGSPLYMAPEQIMSSKDVDSRTDIWALGIILYELLTGATPFVAETMPEIIYMVTQRDPPPLAEKRPDMPPRLAEVVTQCLAREPDKRFANVARLAAALAPFGPPRSEISVERIARVLGASTAPPPSDGSTDSAAARAVRPAGTAATWAKSQAALPRRSKTRAIAIVGGAVALALVVAIRLALRPGPPAPPSLARTTDATAAPPPSAAPTPTPLPSPARAAAPDPYAVLAPPPPEPVALPLPAPSAKPIAGTTPAPRSSAPHSKGAAAPPPAVATAAAGAPATAPAPPANRGLNMGMKE